MTDNDNAEPTPPEPGAPPIGAVWNGTGWDAPTPPAPEPSPDSAPQEPPAGKVKIPAPAAIPRPTPLPPSSAYAGKGWDGVQWTNADGSPFIPPKSPMTTGGKVAIGLGLAVAAGLIGMSVLGNNTEGNVARTTTSDSGAGDTRLAPPPPNAWVPAGYQLSDDSNVAWKWHDGTPDCGYRDSCAAIDVVTNAGCPSGVFVEMAKVDPSGAFLDNSNDIGPALPPGGKSIITVGWLDRGAVIADQKVTVTRMSCM